MAAQKAGPPRKQLLSVQGGFVEAGPFHLFRDGSGSFFPFYFGFRAGKTSRTE
jgi:hypothetical protein